MKKDIYKITNLKNGKIYIGQSVNASHRWEQHVSASKHNPRCVIDQAIAKYGQENFSIIIIERTENFDEAEKRYIEEFNCRVPNGYNVTEGGQSSGVGINNEHANFKTQEQLNAVVDLIRNSSLNFETIAKMVGCSSAVISAINLGKSYFQEELEYPLRESRYDEEKFKQLVYSLKYELDKTMGDIAKEYDIDISNLNNINQGRIRWRSWLQYPLRQGKIYNPGCRYILEIIDLLKNSNKTQTEIAKQFNISKNTVSQINLGKSYAQEGVDYPIRKDYHACGTRKHTLTPNEVREIEQLLQTTDISCTKIAEKYEISASIIRNINNGNVKKYYNPKLTYPLRKF